MSANSSDAKATLTVGGRSYEIYVDVNCNNFAQHSVAPYVLRRRRGTPVATPLHWGSWTIGVLGPSVWSVTDAPRRLAAEWDPWWGWRAARAVCPRQTPQPP